MLILGNEYSGKVVEANASNLETEKIESTHIFGDGAWHS